MAWYIIRVWLTTGTISAILMSFIDSLISFNSLSNILNSALLILFVIAVGLLFSAPTVILQSFSLHYFLKTNKTIFACRLYLSVIALAGIYISFNIYDEGFFASLRAFTWPLTYAIVMLTSIWFYKLVPAYQKTNNE